jgi:hypothetical protein
MEPGQLLARAHGQHLDAAIVIVTHPPGNAENLRLPLDKPAEANALDTSAHEKTAGLDTRLIVCGSHRLKRSEQIAAVKTQAESSYLCNLTSNL